MLNDISMLKNLTLAEGLALFRIITFPLLVAFIFLLEKEVFAWIYLILFSTDVLDGFVAWLQKNDSDRREVLDTWGDNAYFAAALIGFYHYEKEFFMTYIFVIGAIIGLYVFELVLSILKFGKPSNFHNYLAKAGAFGMFVFFVDLFFYDANLSLFLLAVVFCLLDVTDQLLILWKIKSWKTHITGFWKVWW